MRVRIGRVFDQMAEVADGVKMLAIYFSMIASPILLLCLVDYVSPRRAVRAARRWPSHCERCGYTLAGLPARAHCPECGLRGGRRCRKGEIRRLTIKARRHCGWWLAVPAAGVLTWRPVCVLEEAIVWKLIGDLSWARAFELAAPTVWSMPTTGPFLFINLIWAPAIIMAGPPERAWRRVVISTIAALVIGLALHAWLYGYVEGQVR